MEHGDEVDIPGDPSPVDPSPVDPSPVDEDAGGRGTRPRRRKIVAAVAALGLVAAGSAFALSAQSGGHPRVSIESPSTQDPAATIDITTNGTSTTTSAATDTTVDPTTSRTAVNPTPTFSPSSDTTPTDTAPGDTTPSPTTTEGVTTTTLFCPDDGAGGPGCEPISPLEEKTLSASASSCAIASGGQVYCWGETLGLGPENFGSGPVYYSPAAIAVPGVSHATAIAVGGDHVCAIVQNGDVWCWGGDSLGQIGHGDPATDPPAALPNFSLPVAVPGLHGATSIASGSLHSCARLQSGTVWCWGANNAGQLGNDTQPTTSFVPVEVHGISNAASVVANADHSCALLTTSAIRCWGDNSFGALGDGTTHDSAIPVAVSGITHAVQVDAGQLHTCALLADGHVRCWGYNVAGALGDGTTHNSSVPVTVAGIVGARAVSTAQTGTCAIVAGGRVSCWGEGATGQLGDGKWESSTIPVAVSGIVGATAISGHDETKCAAVANGSLRCWGWNMEGSLGDGDANQHSDTPVAVVGFP